ncbi:hypothetical protein BCR35DRAFT_151849 [Leucosporidium creatinivorum]|uniref:BZIP domain-containing protein n=1 Tax=Leucosporidium creatinivorum TaxID=106004 RepID=A0A1Y2ENJ3_9BASI|nr:hypothetical protein BCR35DRAFT_151849 [Leucosporidium creatinivorum]
MATVLSLTPTGGLSRRCRPSAARLPQPTSPFLSPSFFAAHSTSALRSTSPNILVGSAGDLPVGAGVSHDLEINPWEVTLADRSAKGGGEFSAGSSEVGEGANEGMAPSPRSAWEHPAGKRGLPSPALVVVQGSGAEATEERRLKMARIDQDEGREGADRSRRLSTASRLAYLSPPPLEPTTSTDSSSSDESLPFGDDRRSARSKPSPNKARPLPSPSIPIPPMAIAPSPESSQLFSFVQHQQAPPQSTPSAPSIQSYDIAPRPIDLVPSPRLENLPTPTFFSTAPNPFSTSPSTEPAPSSHSIPPSPNPPPRPQAIFLPPLSRIPTLTPSEGALKSARTPPAPLASPQTRLGASKGSSAALVASAGTGRPSMGSPPPAEPSDTGTVAEKVDKGTEKGKGKAKEPVLDALERNRLAAQKCRAKKKERVQGLAATEEALSQANVSLHDEVSSLRADLATLRSEVEQRHPQGACTCDDVQWWRAHVAAQSAARAEEEQRDVEWREMRRQQDLEEDMDELDDDPEEAKPTKRAGKERSREAEEMEGPAQPARKRARKTR